MKRGSAEKLEIRKIVSPNELTSKTKIMTIIDLICIYYTIYLENNNKTFTSIDFKLKSFKKFIWASTVSRTLKFNKEFSQEIALIQARKLVRIRL